MVTHGDILQLQRSTGGLCRRQPQPAALCSLLCMRNAPHPPGLHLSYWSGTISLGMADCLLDTRLSSRRYVLVSGFRAGWTSTFYIDDGLGPDPVDILGMVIP